MSGAFDFDMLDLDLDVPCPVCAYPLWVRVVDVVVGTCVVCPVCRTRVHLVDDAGSMRNVATEVEEGFKNIDESLRGLFS